MKKWTDTIMGNIQYIRKGNALDLTRKLKVESIDCVVTSPPYWKARFYGKETIIVWGGDKNCKHEWVVTNRGSYCKKCGAWKGQLGLEPDMNEYIDHLIEIFDEVYRVLKPTGSVWVNLGDVYMNNSSYSHKGRAGYNKKEGMVYKQDSKVKQKSLCMLPQRFAIKMVDRGWILRNVIIWQKPNAMPSSANDRFTVDFEYVYFFTKSKKYYFEQQLEPYTKPINRWAGTKLQAKNKSGWDEGTGQKTYRDRNMRPNPKGRNKRCVWNINTKPFKGAHFAVFPEELILPMISAGCPKNGWVLDPFMGSGTSLVASKKLNRRGLGFELNSDYIEIAKNRLKEGK